MQFKHILNEMPVESAKTSIRQVASGLKKLVAGIASKDDINLDYGGGRYDDGTDYLSQYGITNLVYDPFNRSQSHNQNVLAILNNKKVDTATCLNVLNVIENKEERIGVVKDVIRYVKSGGIALFQCYKGDGSQETRRTSKGWQLNQPISFYKNEIEENIPGLNITSSGSYLLIHT